MSNITIQYPVYKDTTEEELLELDKHLEDLEKQTKYKPDNLHKLTDSEKVDYVKKLDKLRGYIPVSPETTATNVDKQSDNLGKFKAGQRVNISPSFRLAFNIPDDSFQLGAIIIEKTTSILGGGQRKTLFRLEELYQQNNPRRLMIEFWANETTIQYYLEPWQENKLSPEQKVKIDSDEQLNEQLKQIDKALEYINNPHHNYSVKSSNTPVYWGNPKYYDYKVTSTDINQEEERLYNDFAKYPPYSYPISTVPQKLHQHPLTNIFK